MAVEDPAGARSRARTAVAGDDTGPGLRERKRRALRRKLSQTATAMFLADGFDEVRVSDVAAACEVSPKTVYNHFPTKESLLFDRGDALAAVLTDAVEHPGDVLAAVVALVHDDIDRLAAGSSPGTPARDNEALRFVREFTALVTATPALSAAVGDQVRRLNDLAAQSVAAQTGWAADAPETRIVAGALITVWTNELNTLLRMTDAEHTDSEHTDSEHTDSEHTDSEHTDSDHAGSDHTVGEIQAAARADAERGARLVRHLFDVAATA